VWEAASDLRLLRVAGHQENIESRIHNQVGPQRTAAAVGEVGSESDS
jgi:hypothetical protein